jgi:6-methylsalicylate decarboxylase
MPHGAMAELQKLYFDVATSTSKPALDALLALVNSDHVMFGTDYPFLPTTFTAQGFDRSHLSDADKAAINRLTAARLLPRYA